MRGFGFIGGLFFVLLLFIAGAIGFGLGQGAVPVAGPVAGAPVVYYGHPGFFGFGGFGFLGFFLFLFLIFAVIRIFSRAAWGHRGGGWGHGWGHGYYGRGWDKGSWDKGADHPIPPMADEMLGRWHQQAHSQPSNPTADNKPDSQG